MRPQRVLGALLGPLFLAAATGCTATVVEASADGGPPTTTQALVVFQRAEREGKAARTSISAKFFRAPVAADPDTLESVIGSDLELPAPGECLVVHEADVAVDEPSVGPVALFDAGDITVRTGAGSIPLAARAFPDVGDRVSGVFYTSPDTDGDLPAPGTYILEGSGSSVVDRFSLETEAPGVPAGVLVGGQPLAEGVELHEGEPVEVAWSLSVGSAASTDLAYVEIVSESGVMARCAFEDRGRGVLPGSLLRGSAFGPLPVGATLAVHRVRQGVLALPGVDAGDVRFDMSVAAAVTLRPARRF